MASWCSRRGWKRSVVVGCACENREGRWWFRSRRRRQFDGYRNSSIVINYLMAKNTRFFIIEGQTHDSGKFNNWNICILLFHIIWFWLNNRKYFSLIITPIISHDTLIYHHHVGSKISYTESLRDIITLRRFWIPHYIHHLYMHT